MAKNRQVRNSWASFQPDVPILTRLPVDSYGRDSYRLLALKVEEQLPAESGRGYFLSVTGPDSGVGKTLTSINLALALSKRGERRVLVVEGDFWRPSLRELLRVEPATPGLNDFLADNSGLSLSDVTVSIWSAGIDVISVRKETNFDGDALASDAFGNLALKLRSMYDIVVFDSPPIYLSGGAVLARHADGLVVVIRARKSKKQGIEKLLSEVPQASCLGIVINDVRTEVGSYYDAYYSRRK